MDPSKKEDLSALSDQYNDPSSLMAKKVQRVAFLLKGGRRLLDVGMGPGAFIKVVDGKFAEVFATDLDDEAIELCKNNLKGSKSKIKLFKSDMSQIKQKLGDMNFNCITCLDVLEHISFEDAKLFMKDVYNMLEDDGIFVFTGPGFFEKIKIAMGERPQHLHSHSPRGWKKLIESSGLEVFRVETIQYPLLDWKILRERLPFFGMCCLIMARKPRV